MKSLQSRDGSLLNASKSVGRGRVDSGADGLPRLDRLEHLRGNAGTSVLDETTLKGKIVSGGIGYEEILCSVVKENSVALEDGNSLAGGVGDGDLGDMANGASDLNGQRASRHGRAGEGRNRKNIGDHSEAG